MNPQCARCGKIVYPTEKVNCLDKYWHKACFHCEICRMTLNMKTYKGYEKKPYCNAHYPKQQFTIVADTPENLRLKQQSELQSQAKYKEDFERNRGRGFSIVTDTPELQRLKRTQEQISNKSHSHQNQTLKAQFVKYTLKISKTGISRINVFLDDLRERIEELKSAGYHHEKERYQKSPSLRKEAELTMKETMTKEQILYSSMRRFKNSSISTVTMVHNSVEEDGEEEQEKALSKPIVKDWSIEFAQKCSDQISDVKYKEEHLKSKGKYTFVPDTPQQQYMKNASVLISETKYKELVKKESSKCLYAQMPATIDTVFAKEVSQIQSEKRYKQKYDAEKGKSNYCIMKELPDVKYAMEVNKHQSDVLYKKDAQGMHSYTEIIDRPDIKKAMQTTKLVSNVAYKNQAKAAASVKTSIIGRPDIEHAKEVSKITSQVNYKDKFNKELKERRHHFNPQESASFKQLQAASVLASDVKYKTDRKSMNRTASDLPNLLLLEHVLAASKLQSDHEYKKEFEKSKGHYHLALDTSEQLHHKENAILQSQIKYREEYEKNKGKTMLEFTETPNYEVAKKAQHIQSEKEYRKDFDEWIKGSVPADLDMTPGYLHAKHATSLLNEKEYRKDWEENIKGKVTTLAEDTPDMIRIKHASQILDEKEYRKDWEEGVKGKGLTLLEDTPDMIRVKNASQILNEKEYRKDLEVQIKGKGMELSSEILDMKRAKKASEIVSQAMYKQAADLGQNKYGTVTDTPELMHAAHVKKIYSQKKYKDEAGRMLSMCTTIADTPEIERVKKNQKNLSMLKYTADLQLLKGTVIAVTETPEIRLAKENCRRVSNVLYKEEVGPGTAVKETPEMKRVKENQQNISVVKYKDEVGQGTAVPDLYDLKQIKENQKNISLVKYKDQVGTGTAVSVTLEMERAKRNQSNVSSVLYSNDLKKMKGRPIQLLDTPEMRRVRETQNNISMIKYHEDFERTRGKGFTSVSDDLVTERARKNTQFVSDAMYKGVHPHVVEMEKSRSGIMGEFKVWRTDPGSIFDFDPLEDNIQSRSLHLLSEKAKLCSKQSQSTGVGSISVGDEKSEMTELNTSISSYSEQTMEFSGEREKAKRCSKQSQSAGVGSISVGDEKSEMTELNTSISSHSEHTMEFSGERAAVLPGAYQQMHSPHSPGYGYMHQSSVSSMRPQHSLPHTINMRTYRAMYDYTAADEDEVSFKDGDYIINVQAIDEGWMYGTVQRTGKTGMLPANYVEPLH